MSEPQTRILDGVESLLLKAGVADAACVARAILDAATRCADGADLEQSALAMATQCVAGKPLAYVTRQVRFMDLDLIAAPGALVPRVETELLGWTTLDLLRTHRSDEPRLIDMCCGSGNLVCGMAAWTPSLRAWASDLTEEAVGVARANVERLGLASRVDVVESDLFAALGGRGLEGTVDVVVCNPPYISTGKLARERTELLEHEPREAFDGGPYGVSIFQRVIRDALAFLKPRGTLLFEIGVGQDRQVARLFDRTASYETTVAIANAAGEPRVLSGKKRRGLA